MTDEKILLISLFINLIVFLGFLISYRKDRTKIRNGFLFGLLFLISSLNILIGSQVLNSTILRILMVILLAGFIFISIFGLFILIVFLFINASIVLKKESRSLSNLLTLLIGIILSIFFIVTSINVERLPKLVNYLRMYAGLLLTFFGLSFLNYFLSSILYGIYKPKTNKDYIIVLGSGLIDGDKVSKLLAGRIDRALDFYQLQKKLGKSSKIIFSGGQGPNETISEAEAMKAYALDKGFPEEDSIVENKSKTTQENLRFSKSIMDQGPIKDYEAIFSTSNYHVFRAAIYAKMEGLKATGIGGKTASYYLPNAMIREYIAILVLNKKSYIFKFIVLTLFFLAYILMLSWA